MRGEEECKHLSPVSVLGEIKSDEDSPSRYGNFIHSSFVEFILRFLNYFSFVRNLVVRNISVQFIINFLLFLFW